MDPNSSMLRSQFLQKRKDRGLQAIPGSSRVLRWQLPERSRKVKIADEPTGITQLRWQLSCR